MKRKVKHRFSIDSTLNKSPSYPLTFNTKNETLINIRIECICCRELKKKNKNTHNIIEKCVCNLSLC